MARQRSAPAGADRAAERGQTTSTSAAASATAKGQTHQESQAGSRMDDAKGKAHDLASQAQEKVTQQVRAGVNRGTNRAADALGSVAQSLVFSSQQLRDQDQRAIGGYVERAANKVEQLADYVQNTDAGQMADRVENFARREPALFLGGAFALGLLGARFLKSSRRAQPQQRTGYADQATTAQMGQRPFSAPGAMSDREVPVRGASSTRPAELDRY